MVGEATDAVVKEVPKEISIEDLQRRIAEADADEIESSDTSGTDSKEGIEGSAAEADRAAEQEALSKGWTPKDKFKGPADKWVDAKTFVERGKRFNQNLQNENAALKRQLAEFKGTADAFRKFHKETMDQRTAELDKAKTDLKRALRIADREENDDLVQEIEGRLALIDDEQKKIVAKTEEVQKVPEAPPQLDPILEAWIEDGNEWFREDIRMQAYSIQVGQQLKKEHGDKLQGRAFLDEVRKIMEEDFPKLKGKVAAKEEEEAEPPAPPQRRTIVDGSGRNAKSSAGTKTIRDLPAEDRKLCAEFVANGWTTEKDFLKSYFSR